MMQNDGDCERSSNVEKINIALEVARSAALHENSRTLAKAEAALQAILKPDTFAYEAMIQRIKADREKIELQANLDWFLGRAAKRERKQSLRAIREVLTGQRNRMGKPPRIVSQGVVYEAAGLIG
jgi:hypothetical protein